MPCTERDAIAAGRRALGATVAACSILAGCAGDRGAAPGESRGAAPARVSPAAAPPLETIPASPGSASARRSLPAPGPVRTWAELRRQAAQRMVAANPEITYMGKVPDQLLAIPVLEIELNGDGSIRRIEILRPPREAKDTLQIAADAVRRAGPFGDVSRLPKPWKFVETFLFDEARKFKPRTLD